MKKVVMLIFSALVVSIFVACAGLNSSSAKKAPSSMLTFGSSVKNQQTGRFINVEIETLSFDFYKDRRELVREVYERCSNPSAKFKEFLANGYDTIHLMNEQEGILLRCKFNKDGKFEKIMLGANGLSTFDNGAIYNMESFANEPEVRGGYTQKRGFISAYLDIMDIFITEQAAKGDKNASTQTIKLVFGEETINTSTGKKGVEQRHTLDFDVYKGRRELIKAVYKACSNPSEKMKEYINYELRPKLIGESRERQTSTNISVWYDTKDKGFKEIRTLRCKVVPLGLIQLGYVSLTGKEIAKEQGSLTNMAGTLLNIDFLKSKGNISDSALDEIVDDVIKDRAGRNSKSSEDPLFNYEFMQLFDTAKRIGAAQK